MLQPEASLSEVVQADISLKDYRVRNRYPPFNRFDLSEAAELWRIDAGNRDLHLIQEVLATRPLSGVDLFVVREAQVEGRALRPNPSLDQPWARTGLSKFFGCPKNRDRRDIIIILRRVDMRNSDSVVPVAGNPFYIVTPQYTRISAGVTVLHLLCHYLNLAGENAFIVHYPPSQKPVRWLPHYASLQCQPEVPLGMLTPLLTQDVINAYDELELNPIVIYPEVFDNPLNASFFGRYILNYPGKLNTQYEEKEAFAFAYTQILAEHCSTFLNKHGKISDVLFVPTIDLSFWHLPDSSSRREGICHYIGKLTGIHNVSPEGISNNSIEIKRDIKMSRKDIRRIFQTSEKFYCYEDSALAIEAALCGCETIFVQNKIFSGIPLASKELGFEDKCSTSSHTQVPYDALKYATTLEGNLRKRIHVIPEVVAEFAAKWRKMAISVPYKGTISYPFNPMMIFIDKGIEVDVEPAPVIESTTILETKKITRRAKVKRKAKSAIKRLLTRLKAY